MVSWYGELCAWLFPGMLIAMAIIIVRINRARRDATCPAQPISIDAAEALVRATQLRTVASGLAVIATVSAAWLAGVHAVAVFAAMIAFAVQSYLNSWRARQLLAMPRASAELRGGTLTAGADGSHASVLVSRRAAARARGASVPRATIV